MAAEYQLTSATEPCAVIRYSDGACIPPDMANRDYNGDLQSPGYLQWVEAGGVPDPYVKPPKITIENTSDFIARFTNQEYAKLGNVRATDAQATKVGLSKNWDIVVLADIIELSNQKAQTLKADLVARGVLTQARADEIFS
jgi:hypothetical protein